MTLALTDADIDGAFEGYASLFHRADLTRDIILPGAFRKSLAERGPKGIRMLYQHDPAQPLGTWADIREDGLGLRVRGRLALDVPKAREVHALMRAGALDGLSIGFKPIRFKRDRATGTRRLESVDLWEISIVTFPMQPMARVASVKSAPFGKEKPTARQFERWLTRDAGLTRTEARAVMRQGFDGLRSSRDAGGDHNVERDHQAMIRAAVYRLEALTRLIG
ncbi:MAG: HK97 family phage prohead protease [Hyphomicrobium sp.]|nr:HK97 family phage prohead protease [Hyphomicrobium sp.]